MTKAYNRRDFLDKTVKTGMALYFAGNGLWLYGCDRQSEKRNKKANLSAGNKRYKRIIVLGIDGLDPKLTLHLMRQGRMPNFSSLAKEGSFSPLATSLPPQSPTAWASIATGNNPGHHGIFDFIDRRAESYLPDLAILKQNRKNLLGRRESMFLPVMQGDTFWDRASGSGVNSTVIRWPVTFPPRQGGAYQFAGLGVPDVTGSLGSYTFYTTG